MKGLTPYSGAKVFAIMETSAGLLIIAWPLAWVPGWAYPVAGAGTVAVLAGAFARWRPGPVLAGAFARGRGPALAVAAAVVACAFSRAGILALAAEGLFILWYLLAADAPAGLSRPGSWLRQQVLGVVAGLIASGAVVAALDVHQAGSAALTAAGLAAAVGAYLIALPSGKVTRRAAGRDSDVDVQ
jgi:hypothetical protein